MSSVFMGPPPVSDGTKLVRKGLQAVFFPVRPVILRDLLRLSGSALKRAQQATNFGRVTA
jgi:hypothetical protein